jgi:hypothetical protein
LQTKFLLDQQLQFVIQINKHIPNNDLVKALALDVINRKTNLLTAKEAIETCRANSSALAILTKTSCDSGKLNILLLGECCESTPRRA